MQKQRRLERAQVPAIGCNYVGFVLSRFGFRSNLKYYWSLITLNYTCENTPNFPTLNKRIGLKARFFVRSD